MESKTFNAIGWAFHDVIVHPVTGCLGMVGRVLGSPRLMALAHHLHNTATPSNDVWADYADASKRAGHNEASLGTGHWAISSSKPIVVSKKGEPKTPVYSNRCDTITPVKSREERLREAREAAIRKIPHGEWSVVVSILHAIERVDAEFAAKERGGG